MRRGLLAAALALLAAMPEARAQVPNAHYRQFETEHFRVVFPRGMAAVARRAAAGAEWAYGALERDLIAPPPGRISLVLSDGSDAPNGIATPIPRNRVVLDVAPQIVSRQLNDYPDWLDITLAHELTHVFHLDHAEGVWRIPRALFGRFPLFFPAFYQPTWMIEGLATYEESRLTGAGRAGGTYFRTILSAQARAGAFHPVDAANGLVPRWPAGQTPYAYGSFYLRSLARAHGDSTIPELVHKGAARLPYTFDWAGSPLFGQSLSHGWSAWQERFRTRERARADSLRAASATLGQPLAPTGWATAAPRFSPDGRMLAYSRFDPTNDPATVVIDPGTGAVLRRARRNGASGTTWSVDGRALYYGQPDYVTRYRIYSDLYRLDLARGDERRLTHGARVIDPDMAPDGRRLVAVQEGEATNRLVLVDPTDGGIRPLTAFVDTVNWAHPRWSPDGRRIAAERWVRGGIVDVVVVALASDGGRVESVQSVTHDVAVDMTPTWTPDGRQVVWSSNRSGTFDLYIREILLGPAADDPPPRRLTHVIGGALDPAVSPQGDALAYVEMVAGGFRLKRIPFDPASASVAPSAPRTLPPSPWPGQRPDVSEPAHGYSPFPSIWPAAWFPVAFYDSGRLGTFVGASTFGSDDLSRHTYAAFAGWRFGIDEPEGALLYLYRGLGNPTLRLDLSQDWSVRSVTAQDLTVDLLRRHCTLDLSAGFLWPHVRTAFSLRPELSIDRYHYTSTDPRVRVTRPTDTRLEGALGIGFSTARRYPRSVSAARGFSVGLRLAHARWPRGGEADPWRWSGEVVLQGYQALGRVGYGNQLLAGRLALGVSTGRLGGAETFALGGVPGAVLQVLPGVDIGGGADYPVRGFLQGVQFGDRIAAGSLEYRFPLWLIGRGHGLWPLLLDRLSGALFVDGGAAWDGAGPLRGVASTGGELSLDLGVAYALAYRIRFGLARTIAAPGLSNEWRGYASAGVAF